MEGVIHETAFIQVTVIVFNFVIFGFLLSVLVVDSSPKIQLCALALFFSLHPLAVVLVIVRFERALALELVVLEFALVHLAPRDYFMTASAFFVVVFPLTLVPLELRLEDTVAVPLSVRKSALVE
jgi:hypothetical protein